MVQTPPALGASARMTLKVVSFPLIAGLLLLKPVASVPQRDQELVITAV